VRILRPAWGILTQLCTSGRGLAGNHDTVGQGPQCKSALTASKIALHTVAGPNWNENCSRVIRGNAGLAAQPSGGPLRGSLCLCRLWRGF